MLPLDILIGSPSSSPSHDLPLTTREASSGILGSISLACWIFLLLPQLVENYRNSSAEAISLAFIFVWFIGDVCNLIGALWASLVPVIIAIAIYFCIADGVLIGQCLYYGIRNKRREARRMLRRETSVSEVTESTTSASREDEPLLSRERSGSYAIPGSMQRRSSQTSNRSRRRTSSSAQRARNEQLAKILEESDENGVRLWFKNVLSVLGILVVGAVGWGIAYRTGAWKPTPMEKDVDVEEMAAGAQILGYASAVAYLGARIPQIIKNWREKSCEGKSEARPEGGVLIFCRTLIAVLHPVTIGKPHIWSRNSEPFDRDRICHQEPTMVDRQSRDYGRRCHDIRSISPLPKEYHQRYRRRLSNQIDTCFEQSNSATRPH